MMRSSSSNGFSKSAGKTRKSPSVSSTERPAKGSLNHKMSTVNSVLDGIDSISEEERTYKFENYEKTGDFGTDFTCLCQLRGIQLGIGNRPKLPGMGQLPELGTPQDKTKLNSSLSQDKIKVNSPEKRRPSLSQEKPHESDEDAPTTYALAKDKYDYFKPRLEIETEFDNKEYVKGLYLRGWKADKRVIAVLSRTLPELEKLTVLNMWNAGLDDETLHALGECLTSSSSLKTMCLDGNCFVASQDFHVFLKQPSKLKLQHLSLRHCKINAEGASKISRTLSENRHLVTLNLCFNELGDEGMRHLADSLCINRTLLSLNVGSNEIGDDGVKYIARAISRFPLNDDQVIARKNQLSLQNDERNESVSSSQQEKALTMSPQTPGKMSRETSRVSRKKESGKTKSKGSKPSADKSNKTLKNVKTEATKDPDDGGDDEDPSTFKNPLLEKATVINGEIWLPGNRSLINLNLSRNKVNKVGLELLYTAVAYQDELAASFREAVGPGLMKLSLKNNIFPEDDATYVSLFDILRSRDPLRHHGERILEENGC